MQVVFRRINPVKYLKQAIIDEGVTLSSDISVSCGSGEFTLTIPDGLLDATQRQNIRDKMLAIGIEAEVV